MSKHILFTLGLAAGCSAALAQTQAVSTEAWHAVPDARGVQLVHVECRDGIFDPREIVVKHNMPVELSVRTPETSHEFVSDFGPSKPIGRDRTIHRFTPTAQGHFTVACQKQGVAEDARVKARKRGRLTVMPDEGNTR